MRILLVEDDRELCRSLKLMLERQGFDVTVSNDGLFLILENAHDLVLLDRMQPGMDGMEVLRLARRQHITVPVIFLTALGSLDERITGLDCGADDYIVKPFAFEELMARIRCAWSSAISFTAGSRICWNAGIRPAPSRNAREICSLFSSRIRGRRSRARRS